MTTDPLKIKLVRILAGYQFDITQFCAMGGPPTIQEGSLLLNETIQSILKVFEEYKNENNL